MVARGDRRCRFGRDIVFRTNPRDTMFRRIHRIATAGRRALGKIDTDRAGANRQTTGTVTGGALHAILQEILPTTGTTGGQFTSFLVDADGLGAVIATAWNAGYVD
jgi:hypothetical protein